MENWSKGPFEDPVKPAVYFTSDISVICDPRIAATGKTTSHLYMVPPNFTSILYKEVSHAWG